MSEEPRICACGEHFTGEPEDCCPICELEDAQSMETPEHAPPQPVSEEPGARDLHDVVDAFELLQPSLADGEAKLEAWMSVRRFLKKNNPYRAPPVPEQAEPWNGCFTGDCTHETDGECVEHLGEYVAEIEQENLRLRAVPESEPVAWRRRFTEEAFLDADPNIVVRKWFYHAIGDETKPEGFGPSRTWDVEMLYTHPPVESEGREKVDPATDGRWLAKTVHDQSCPSYGDDGAKCTCGFDNYYEHECQIAALRGALEEIARVELEGGQHTSGKSAIRRVRDFASAALTSTPEASPPAVTPEDNPSADALDDICKIIGAPDWEYPGQVVRDVAKVVGISLEEMSEMIRTPSSPAVTERGEPTHWEFDDGSRWELGDSMAGGSHDDSQDINGQMVPGFITLRIVSSDGDEQQHRYALAPASPEGVESDENTD